MNILGINAYHGDASAALLSGGQLVRAVEEERFNRVKHCAGFPKIASEWCAAAVGLDAVDHAALSRDPKAHLWRKVFRAALRPQAWKRFGSRAGNLAQAGRFADELQLDARTQVHFVEHHRAHLASAFFCSPFEEAAVISIDGFGDYSSAMWAHGRGNRMEMLGAVHFPHSLGIFYTAFTQFLGFHNFGDEYKMMGLSAYGEPRFRDQVRHVVRTVDGDIRLDLDYFTHHSQGLAMSWDEGAPKIGAVYSAKMIDTFGDPRQPRTEILQQHADMAASVQAVLEENYFALLNHVQKVTGSKAVCLAGGVALNCVANGKIFENTPFERVYVQPAANDSGTSIGAALYVQHQVLGAPREFEMKHVYYGPSYGDEEIARAARAVGARFEKLDRDQLLDRTAGALADGMVTGWFQGGMEIGPRALGARSILADPRRMEMKDTLNLRIKFREPFRPFCPSILAGRVGEYFENDHPSPFMVKAYKIRPSQRGRIPAVTHGDGTGRLQTVEREANPLYYDLIERFSRVSGVPVLINTSFNENEPMVNTPEQALDCFLRTRMDVLVMGSCFFSKTANRELSEHRAAFGESKIEECVPAGAQ